MDERKMAEWLANIDSNGASDEGFAETIVLAYMIHKTGNKNYILTAEDMNNFDITEFSVKLQDTLREILHSEEIDPSCWWKKEKRKKKYRVRAISTYYSYAVVEAYSEAEALDIAEEMDGGDFISEDYEGDWEVNVVEEISDDKEKG